MGVFSAAVEVRHKSWDEFVSVEALMDTGAIYTMLPEDLLEPLGIERLDSDIFEPANGNLVEYAIGDAVVRLGGRTRTAPVVFGRPGNTPLLGATTLELLRHRPFQRIRGNAYRRKGISNSFRERDSHYEQRFPDSYGSR